MPNITGQSVIDEEISPEEADRIKKVKAELAAAKERQFAKGRPSPALKRYVQTGSTDEPATNADAARSAVASFRQATRDSAPAKAAPSGDGRGVRHDPAIVEQLPRDNPHLSVPKLCELYQAKTGRSISDVTVRTILAKKDLPTQRADACPDYGTAFGARQRCYNRACPTANPGGRKAPTPTRPAEPKAARPVEAPKAATPAIRQSPVATVVRRETSGPMAELDAMRAIADALAGLEADAAARVLAWVGWHYGGGGPS